MTTDEAWEAKISEYADQLSEYFPRYIHGHIGREGFENLLGRIIRETVEACAAACTGIGKEIVCPEECVAAILALIPKGDGRG